MVWNSRIFMGLVLQRTMKTQCCDRSVCHVFLDSICEFFVDQQLIQDHGPVLIMTALPFFLQLCDPQIEKLIRIKTE